MKPLVCMNEKWHMSKSTLYRYNFVSLQKQEAVRGCSVIYRTVVKLSTLGKLHMLEKFQLLCGLFYRDWAITFCNTF